MKQLQAFSLGFFVAALISFPTWASEEGTRVYLPAGSVDAADIVAAPPRPGSPEFAQQMAVVLWMQRTRTGDQVAFVKKPLGVDRFALVLNERLFSVDGAYLKEVIDDVIDEVRAEYDALKAAYDLPRPFQVNNEVKPVVAARPVESYPSGHAIRAIVYARLLAEVFPAQREQLVDYAERVGYGRVIAGVHYPMDVIAGQKLGHAYADVIVAQGSFLEAVERVRTSL